VFHLLRGEWLAASGQTARAEREWMWHEASDIVGWPEGLSQAGEVSAALGVFARVERARVLLGHGGSAADWVTACRHLARVEELWSEADAPLRPLADTALALGRSCPR
jgi:hypothetical protein